MQGLTILDLSRVLAGPWATQQLADQGATVIKVEPPGGDETRHFGPVVQGVSAYHLAANRNKRSIVLDLHTEAGRAVLDRLVARADAVVENFRPGVAERLGLDWDDLHARHPRLVYVSIKAFGEEGDPAWLRRPGYDIVLQAMGGAASITGFPGGPPLKAGTSIADLTTGLWCTQAILLGLLHRERTGEGQKIVVNMLHAQACALAYHATRYLVTGEVEGQRGNSHGSLAPYDLYRCRDGWLALGCGNDGIWQRLRAALGLADEPAWRDNAGRVAHREAVDRAVGGALGALSVAEADGRLAQAGVPAGPVLHVDEVLAHPAVHLVEMAHPVLGPVRAPGPPLCTLTTRAVHEPPAALGADLEAVLAEAGFAEAECAAFRAAGAFGGQ